MSGPKQRRIDELRAEKEALRREVADYKHRHDMAIDALNSLSQGRGVKLSWMTDAHDWKHAMANLAGNTLAQIAKYPLREAP